MAPHLPACPTGRRDAPRYLGFGDVGFWLDGGGGAKDCYWMARASGLLIRGGANYSQEQVAAELHAWAATRYALEQSDFELAVSGLKIQSEHEDSVVVTVQLVSEKARAARAAMEASFLKEAAKGVSKGSKPDRLRFGEIPRNFKGAVLSKELTAAAAKEIFAAPE